MDITKLDEFELEGSWYVNNRLLKNRIFHKENNNNPETYPRSVSSHVIGPTSRITGCPHKKGKAGPVLSFLPHWVWGLNPWSPDQKSDALTLNPNDISQAHASISTRYLQLHSLPPPPPPLSSLVLLLVGHPTVLDIFVGLILILLIWVTHWPTSVFEICSLSA